MIDDLYNTGILTLAANIENAGRLEAPHGSSRKVSKLCGSWVEVDVEAENEIVTDFKIRLQACALGQASSAILSQSAIGSSLTELRDAQDRLRAMLKEGGPSPTGRFGKLALLADVANYPARHASTMLAFEAVVEAMEMIS